MQGKLDPQTCPQPCGGEVGVGVGECVGVGDGDLVGPGVGDKEHPEVSCRFIKPPVVLSHCTQPQKLPPIEQLLLFW